MVRLVDLMCVPRVFGGGFHLIRNDSARVLCRFGSVSSRRFHRVGGERLAYRVTRSFGGFAYRSARRSESVPEGLAGLIRLTCLSIAFRAAGSDI